MDKNLELQIKIFIAQELEKGTSLSEIQNLVNENFSQRMTYMDIRILASSLDVDWRALSADTKDSAVKEDADEKVPEENPQCDAESREEDPESLSDTETEKITGDTVVEVNPLARPGMMFSGTVKFASGSTAEWYVDNMGRLGVENLVGDKPDQNDIEKFQVELDKVLRKMMGR